MEGVGAEVSEKIRSAIKAKLMEIGVYVDEELPDYVMVMVANKRSKEQMDDDLQLFLGKHTSLFTTWLHQVLQKLQEVTVANLGGIKKKISEDLKKKKKSKSGIEKKEPKKKIKVEDEDVCDKEDLLKSNEIDKDNKNDRIEDGNSGSSNQHDKHIEPKIKEKTVVKTVVEKVNESSFVSKNKKVIQESASNSEYGQKLEEDHRAARSKSHSISSQIEDVDDEDCINIRTDGELLDTAEEVNTEDQSRKQGEREDSTGFNKNGNKNHEKRQTIINHSPIRQKDKQKSEDHSVVVDRPNQNISVKKQLSPPSVNDKVVDARELLNRKKAAKQCDIRGRAQSKDRSLSPPRKRRDDREINHKIYYDDRDVNRKTVQEDEESFSRRMTRDEERDRRVARDRDSHSLKRREDRPSRRNDSDRVDSRDGRRRDSSSEPLPKRVMIERPFRKKNDDWNSTRSSNKASLSEGRKVGIESSVKRREFEEPRKRSGLVSRVVPRSHEPEDDVETPVLSVVKVTPRPRRPPSQQPSSTLIMRAISEANKSLANVPQRPDSTQRARKEPVFTRTLRQLEMIPPEKIAVSITNQLALQNDNSEVKDKNNGPSSPTMDETARNRSPPNILMDVTSPEPDYSVQNKISHNNEWTREEKVEKESLPQETHETEIELEPNPEMEEAHEEYMEEMSDPQFVVTLNGYDPDGLYSQSEMDMGEEGDCDDWLKENMDEEPLLTSTPDEVQSPRPKREHNNSPIIIMNTPAVNHSNLIEVELVKTKTSERCKYWPACRLADKCTFYHPSKPCKLFPACKFGNACLYIHPQCKFNTLCTRKDCVFAHTPAHTPLQPAALPKTKALYAASAPQQCKFYPNCTNINCQFVHPLRACRFGLYCTKKDCSFDHGQVAPIDKLKWTRVPTT